MFKIHRLKILTEHFEQILVGNKSFEVRKDDRGFEVGDYLLLEEWSDDLGYSGRIVMKKVPHLLRDPCYVKEGYVILSLGEPKEEALVYMGSLYRREGV